MSHVMDSRFQQLCQLLCETFAEGYEAGISDETFNRLALEVFAFQCDANPTLKAFAVGRGVRPGLTSRWEDIPAVPAAAFKALPLVTTQPEAVQRVFRTSGTTQGVRRGEHYVRDLLLYQASALPHFEQNLLPDGVRPRFISLIPPAEGVPDSSLSYMTSLMTEAFSAEGGAYFASPTSEIDVPGLEAALDGAAAQRAPVLLMGTAFAFVHWLESVEPRACSWALPEGSRMMETGGFKGRAREVSRAELYTRLSATHGIPTGHIVNEYGMTEMLSQFYEPVLRCELDTPLDERALVGPPWVRTRILDPATLEDVTPGEPGLLCHTDLANAGSVVTILTEDLGVKQGNGFRVLGRVQGAEPRGCSLALEDVLKAAVTSR